MPTMHGTKHKLREVSEPDPPSPDAHEMSGPEYVEFIRTTPFYKFLASMFEGSELDTTSNIIAYYEYFQSKGDPFDALSQAIDETTRKVVDAAGADPEGEDDDDGLDGHEVIYIDEDEDEDYSSTDPGYLPIPLPPPSRKRKRTRADSESSGEEDVEEEEEEEEENEKTYGAYRVSALYDGEAVDGTAPAPRLFKWRVYLYVARVLNLMVRLRELDIDPFDLDAVRARVPVSDLWLLRRHRPDGGREDTQQDADAMVDALTALPEPELLALFEQAENYRASLDEAGIFIRGLVFDQEPGELYY